MACKTRRDNFRVEISPKSPGDFGSFFIAGQDQSEANWESDCEEIAEQIRRHVDGLPTGGRQGVTVVWDDCLECEHCGRTWTEGENSAHNGGCCPKDGEVYEQFEEAPA